MPFGKFTYEENSNAVMGDTIYDVASITKAIPTGSIALQLLEEGKIRLEDKLIKYLPEFSNSDRENVLIKHLLTYTLGGYGLSSLKLQTMSELHRVIMTKDFDKRPGEVLAYSNITAYLLGLVIEKVTGKSLDVNADERFFKPLKMERTTFFPEKFFKDEIPPTEINDRFGLVHGHVHDEFAWICKQENKIVGNAGLFSSANDILSFLEVLLNKGTVNAKKYFSENTVEQMATNQIAYLNNFAGLGFELNQPRFMGRFANEHTFGKTGFTGTAFIVDIAKEIAYTILTNSTYPKRGENPDKRNNFRKEIGEIILNPENRL